MVKLKVGDCLKVETKTQDDVFGTCIYKIIETGLPSPERGRSGNDGLRCVMLGGSGEAAREGFQVQDSEWRINQDIERGITKVIVEKDAVRLKEAYENRGQDSGSGVLEVD